jgi:predicted RNA-binding Zn ribbon-like protein
MTHFATAGSEPDQADELFAAFTNTLALTHGRQVDHVADIDSLLDWLRRYGLISDRARAAEAGRLHRDPAEAARRVERFAHLRDVLRRTVAEVLENEHPSGTQLRELNHILRHGLHYHELRREPEATRYSFAQVGDRLDQARATIASSFAQYLADEPPSRLRICANDGCRWVFVDRSPAGRRRWCDMRTCGNQAKVARHRARARAGQGVPAGGPAD